MSQVFRCKYQVAMESGESNLYYLKLFPSIIFFYMSESRGVSLLKLQQSWICPVPCAFQQRLPSKVVFHQRMSFLKECIQSKFVFHQKLSSIKGPLQSKVVFHQRSFSIKSRLSSKVVFYQRLSSTDMEKVCLLPRPSLRIFNNFRRISNNKINNFNVLHR